MPPAVLPDDAVIFDGTQVEKATLKRGAVSKASADAGALVIVRAPEDGACLYHSICMALEHRKGTAKSKLQGNNAEAQSLREQSVAHLGSWVCSMQQVDKARAVTQDTRS